MLKMSEMEEHNSRDLKSGAEKNEMTDAFNILKKMNSIGKEDKGSVLGNDRDMRNRWKRYVVIRGENNSDGRQEIMYDPPVSINTIEIF